MRKGISLITLIITIVVVIILAAAVILSLIGNNPINNAKIANLVSTKDNIESGILTYVSKMKSKTLGYYDTFSILSGNDEKIDPYRLIEKNEEELVTCIVTKNEEEITLYKLDNGLFKEKIDNLPATPNNKSQWYIDCDGKVYLVFDEDGQAPKWMTNKNNKIDNSTLLTFVVYKGGVLGDGVSGNVEIPKEPEWYEKIEEADASWFTYSSDKKTITGFSSAYPGTPTDIKLPTTVDGVEITSIGPGGFRYSGITSLVIPGSIKSITYEESFRSCTKLEKLRIEEGFTDLGLRSFVGCTALKEVSLPQSLTSYNVGVNNSSFRECNSIEKIIVPQKVVGSSVQELFCHSKATIKEVEFNGTITGIGGNSFQSMTGITSIELPDTVAWVGSWSFNGCSNLKTVKLNKSLKNIGSYAFSWCPSLTDINLAECTSLTDIGEDAFRSSTALEKIEFPEANVNVNPRIFRDCTGLKEATISSKITSMYSGSSNGVFRGCTNLKKIICRGKIPEGSPWGAPSATVVKE